MNAIIVGGGSKFGKFVVENLRHQGHQVYVLSHKNHDVDNPNHFTANFNDIEDTKSHFLKILNEIETLDLFLYATNKDYGPQLPEHFRAGADNVDKFWSMTMQVNVVIPHELSLLALKKTNKDSRLVFMTSGMASDFERSYHPEMAGYAGSKAALSHLMFSLAEHNTEIICALSPHFPLDDDEQKLKAYNNAFKKLISLSHNDKGKIIKLYLTPL